MDGLLKVFGFDSKPTYKEKIPDTLTKDCFKVHNTFRHGFSSQPLSLGYDSVQQLLAIGTEHGSVLLLGKPGLERHIDHPTSAAVTHLEFIINKGLLVTGCDNNTFYLWDLKEKEPRIQHTLELVSEKPTATSYVFGSDWMYVGTWTGNVHLLNLHTFKISGFSIHWNNAVELSCRHKPGDVISVQEHPVDQGKVLIAFSGGKCVLFDLKAHSEGQGSQTKDGKGDGHKRFNYDPGSDHILTCVSWLGNGKNFACSYSDGTIVLWSPKSELKPEKVFPLHEIDPMAFKPIYKMQQILTESDPWIVATGGYPEGNDLAPRTLTVMKGKGVPRMLSTEDTILDFLCLPSSPYASDYQKPFALVILTKTELIVHDLEQPEYPRYPDNLVPYALDIHHPGVTFLHYSANCSDEFVASLHSVKSKLMKASVKPWPLKAGKWGQEVPHTSTDLIVTGHVDGSVRLWYCTSVILQPFFTLSTSQYFEMQYPPSPSSSPTKKSSPSVPPSKPKPTPSFGAATPNPTLTNKVLPPPDHPPPPRITTQRSCPAGELKVNVADKPAITSVPEGEEGETGHSQEDSTDGQSGANALTVERVRVADKRKSIFKKKKQDSRGSSPSLEDNSLTLAPTAKGSEEKKKHTGISLKKSFRKIAKVVKISRSMGSKDRASSTEEADGDSAVGDDSSTIADSQKGGVSDASPPKQRPTTIPILASPGTTGSAPGSQAQASGSATNPPSPTKPTKTTSPGKVASTDKTTSPVLSPPGEPVTLRNPNPATPNSSHHEDFFPIHTIEVCTVGLWMCVANKGGAAMGFNFQLTEQDTPPKALDINFDRDSLVRRYTPSTSLFPASPPPPTGGQWSFSTNPPRAQAGFQLCQVCMCSYHTQPKNALKRDPKKRVPAKISVMKYSVDLGLLVIGTNRGFALVNTDTSTCLHILSTLTSFLYMSDPPKFTRQLRKESENQLPFLKPLVRRHSTQRALHHSMVTPTKPNLNRLSEPRLPLSPPVENEELEDDCFDDKEMTVSELDCSVTALELVQLQLDSKVHPSLTLWVGLASGHLVAYGVNMTKKDISRKIDLIPTKIIQEAKSPIVGVVFLNEWGDRQLVPYQRKRTNLTGSPEPETPKAKTPPATLERYAIVVSEQRIQSYSFPGSVKLESCSVSLSDGAALLQSEYFTCNDLPCLLSVASNRTVFIHSLPGLKELLNIQLDNLSITRAVCTFHVSGQGQGIFMRSDSEFQRLSVVMEDKLNLPACLPSLYTKMADPEPYHGGMGKRLLDALFTAAPSTVDREHLFGEAARKPVGNLYKLDGRMAAAYAGKRDRDKEDQRQRTVRGEAAGKSKATGVAGQLEKNVQALNERKEKLSAIEQKTEAVAQQASDFADLAKRLRQKYEH